jgi:hypothetical protein
VVEALANPRRFQPMRVEARRAAIEQFDLKRVSLPQMLALVRDKEAVAPEKSPKVRRKQKRVLRQARTASLFDSQD